MTGGSSQIRRRYWDFSGHFKDDVEMTSCKEETHLKYGDTVLLTQKGAMLGSYYTNDAVSNLFMLPLDNKKLPHTLPCSKTCGCFRIMPLYEYESLEELKEEKKRKKINWNKILELENNMKHEEKDNKKRLNRYIGRVVRYDHAVQFFHLYSGKILTASAQFTSHTEPRNFACYLDSDPSKHSRFKLLPAVDGYDPGDPVNHSDFINLYSDPDGFVGTSNHYLDPILTLYPPLPEVFIGPRGGGFSIKLYKEVSQSKIITQVTESSLRQSNILNGDLVQFINKSLNSYLTVDEDNNLILKKSSINDPRHVTSLPESYWVIETLKGKYSSPVQITSGSGTAQDIRLINFRTGKKAKFPTGVDHTSLKSLIRITTLDIKSGDCVKLFSEKTWLSFGNPEGDGSVRKLICIDHRDHTDLFTIHKIDVTSKQRKFKLLGFKLLLNVIIDRCEQKSFSSAILNNVISSIQEMNDYIDSVKKKSELYEDCLSLGITDNCFNICKILIPMMRQGKEYKQCVEWMVVMVRGMMKNCGEVLDDQGLELTKQLFLDNSGVGLEAFLNIIKDNVNLISQLPSDLVEALVEDYNNHGKPIYLKVLRKLCKCKRQAVNSNQNIIIKCLFGDKLHKRFIKIKHDKEKRKVVIFHLNKGIPLSQLNDITNQSSFKEFQGQLDLIENMFYGKNSLAKKYIIEKYGLFSEQECVDVITNENIDVKIRSTYIKILVAAHIDPITNTVAFEPKMLSYQYKKEEADKLNRKDIYAVLDKWLLNYVESNINVVTSQENINQFKNSVILLVEYMFRKEYLEISGNHTERYIKAMMKWLDGRDDMCYEDHDTDDSSREVFRKIFRFRNLSENKKCNAIKQRVLETLHLAFWHCLAHFWKRMMKPIYAILYEHISTDGLIKQDMKQNIHSAVQGVIPNMSLSEGILTILKNGFDCGANYNEAFYDFQEDILSEIYLFSDTPDITTVLLDVLNYESNSLTSRATELMVLLFSPIHTLLRILPKTQIMIAEETYLKRKEITDNYITILRLTSDPLTENMLTLVIEAMNKLRNACLNEGNIINKTIQKFVFDLGTVKEIIRIVLSTKNNISSACLPTDANEYMDSKLLQLKIQSFRLLKVVISGLESGQELAMENFKDLLTVKDEEGIDADGALEQAKAYALDEIFTDNTNLSLNVQEDEILELFHLIIESVTATPGAIDSKAKYSYLYLAIIENMIDMEDSTDFLCKHQTFVLRLIREYWNELNGRIIQEDGYGDMREMNLLNLTKYNSGDVVKPATGSNFKEDLLSGQRGWQGLYFTHMISLMACCVVGDAKSTETICKEQYPLSVIFPLLRASRNDIIYFTCLSKFVLNVYIKSSSVMNRQQLLGSELTWYIHEGVVLIERVTKNLTIATSNEKMTYLNILGDLKTQIKLLSSRDDIDVILKDLVCYYDYIFFVLCPIVTNIFNSDRDMVEATFTEESRQNIVKQLCKFAKFVSPFLDNMLWSLLFEAIEAVNRIDASNLTEYAFSDKSNKMYYFDSHGQIEVADKPLFFNKEVQDVMDLILKKTGYRLKEAYTKKVMKEVKENHINEAFQKIVAAIIQTTERPKEGKFVNMSEELKSLGCILFEPAHDDNSKESFLNFAPFCDESDDDFETHEPVPQLDKIIQKIENEECSDYTMVRLINVFAVLAEDSNRSKEESKEGRHFRMGNSPAMSLLQLGLTEGLGSLMGSCQNDHIQQAVTECLMSLLQIPTTKNRLREYCSTTEEPLFEWCLENINAAIEGNTQLCMIEAMRNRAGMDGVMDDVGIVSSTPVIRLSVQVIGAMCDGQYTDMQNYLRFQDNKVISHNFLVKLIRLLQCVRSGELLMDTLKSLNAMISANDTGKETAIENDMVEILNNIIASEVPANDVSNIQEIKSLCYALLSTLVEQSNLLVEFYDKVREDLDIKTLQSEINVHLERLEQDYKAQNAAFKGYALLKKISSLDKKDYVGKLDDEISQKLKVGSVEVQWKGHLEKVYYPIPKSGCVRNKIKEELKWGIDRKSKFDKQRDFLLWSQEIVDDVAHQKYFMSIPALGYIMKHDLWWDWLVFLIALALQLWVIKEWRTLDGEDANNPLPEYAQECYDRNETMICPSEGFYFTIVCLGTVHMIACLFLAISYFIANYHRIMLKHDPNKRMTIRWYSFYHFYLAALLICSALGIMTNGMMYCFHLFHIATLFDLLGRVIRGATKHADQLMVCVPFAVIIAYCYAIIYFGWFRKMFSSDKMEYCSTLGECLITVLKNSLRPSSGGHNYSWTGRREFSDLVLRLIIDASFWILFTIIGLNVVTSLILDGFRQLKAEREKALKDMTTLCTICGLSKDYLTGNNMSWATHVERDHNIWSYITFFYYLQEHSGPFSAVENEVLQKFKKADPSFLPSGRCISMETKVSINKS